MPEESKSGTHDNGKDVIKHSGAIHMSGRISLLERKTWNVLLANAFNVLEQQETHEISLRDLARYLRYNSNDHELLKEALRTLNHTQVEWNVLDKDKQVWAATTLLAGVEIINGVCRYGYSFVLRERLNDPLMYARLNLIQQSFFRRKYAHILWELFKDYFDEKKGYGETPWITIQKFRTLLGLASGEYELFKELNKMVIKKAITEINEISDLCVDLKSGIKKRRDGRKIGALKFIIKRNQKTHIKVKVLEDFAAEAQGILPVPEFEIENQKLFDTLTGEFGISNNKAAEILKTKDEFYILDVLESVRDQINEGKVKNAPAFTVKAIEDDYRRKKSKDEIEKEEEQARKAQAKKDKETLEKLKAEFDAYFKSSVKATLNSLGEKETAQLIQDFEKDVMDSANQFLRKSYHKKGVEAIFIQGIFYSYAAKKYLSPQDFDFILFAKEKGYVVEKLENGEHKLVSEK